MIKSLNDIEFVDQDKILGEGAFSEVFKVKRKSDGKLFALKKVDLNQLEKEDMVNLDSEVELHQKIEHPNIIKFVSHFKDNQSLYFILEYAGNSCLFFYIHSVEGLPEKLALRFFYQTALAVQHLHKYNLIHRDIKPENILLDSNFNIKLCDFGWSCFLENDAFRTSICGTYEYMSPEIIYGKRHTNKVDVWCMGILLYEMLHGNPPFKADNLKQIKDEFMTKNILLRKSLSTETKDLLKNILKTDDKKRYTIDQILEHPAMKKNINFFNEVLSEKDFAILVKNYMLNSDTSGKRIVPDAFENLVHLVQSPFKPKVDLQKLLEENQYKPEQQQNTIKDNKPIYSNVQNLKQQSKKKESLNFKKKQSNEQVTIKDIQKESKIKKDNQENYKYQSNQNLQRQDQQVQNNNQPQKSNVKRINVSNYSHNNIQNNFQNKDNIKNNDQFNINKQEQNQNTKTYKKVISKNEQQNEDKKQYLSNNIQQININDRNIKQKDIQEQSNTQKTQQNLNKINKQNQLVNNIQQQQSTWTQKVLTNQQKEVQKQQITSTNPFTKVYNSKQNQQSKFQPNKKIIKDIKNEQVNNKQNQKITNERNSNYDFKQRVMRSNFGSSKYISLPQNQFGVKIIKNRSQSRKKRTIKIDILKSNKQNTFNTQKNNLNNPPNKFAKRQASQNQQKNREQNKNLTKSGINNLRNQYNSFQQLPPHQITEENKTVTRRISLWKN